MVQDQLVDYISAQMKLGAARETITAALLGAGWQAADVSDSFKKVESAHQPASPTGTVASVATKPAAVQPAQPSQPQPMATGGASSFSSASSASKPAAATTAGPGPQVIRMSDLVSASDGPVATASMAGAGSKPAARAMIGNMGAAKKEATSYSAPATAQSYQAPSSKRGLVTWIVGGVVFLGLAGLSAYLYMQNNSLSGQVSSLSGQSSSVTSQIASLTAQVNSLTVSSTANATQLAGLASANQELMTELSFYAVPPGGIVSSTQISVTGSLNVNASKNYFLIASYGGKIFISNSKDANAAAALQPLVGSSTKLSGTFIPGSDTMTVTSVNGISL